MLITSGNERTIRKVIGGVEGGGGGGDSCTPINP